MPLQARVRRAEAPLPHSSLSKMDADQDIEARRRKPTLRARLRSENSIPKSLRLAVLNRLDGQLHTPLGPQAVTAYCRLTSPVRDGFVHALLPDHTPDANQALQALDHRPYRGPLSPPFRCPKSPVVVAEMQLEWLIGMATGLDAYHADLPWLARWGHRLPDLRPHQLAWMLAGALSAGGPRANGLLAIFRDLAEGPGPCGGEDNPWIHACLASSNPQAWELVDPLLSAAKEDSCLRAAILNAAENAHPGAFVHALKGILAADLLCIHWVAVTVDTWLGSISDHTDVPNLRRIVEYAIQATHEPFPDRFRILEVEPIELYLHLWALAIHDVEAAVRACGELIERDDSQIRLVALYLLHQTRWSDSTEILLLALQDKDMRAVHLALESIRIDGKHGQAKQVFDACWGLYNSLGSGPLPKVDPFWLWTHSSFEKQVVVETMLRVAPPERHAAVKPMISEFEPNHRGKALALLAGIEYHDWKNGATEEASPANLPVFLHHLGDASSGVRGVALRCLAATPIQTAEVERWYELLHRKAKDLRVGAIRRLKLLPASDLAQLARRLLGEKQALRREAGLELAQILAQSGHRDSVLQEALAAYTVPAVRKSRDAKPDPIIGAEPPTTENGLGLINPNQRAVWPTPQDRGRAHMTLAAQACVESLAECILRNADTVIERSFGNRRRRAPLLADPHADNIQPTLPPFHLHVDPPPDIPEPPLPNVWQAWSKERPSNTRDDDGLELVRVLLCLHPGQAWHGPSLRKLVSSSPYAMWSEGGSLLLELLPWLIRWSAPKGVLAFALDHLETRISEWDPSYTASLRSPRDPPHRWLGEEHVDAPPWRWALGIRRAHEGLNRIRSVQAHAMDELSARRLYQLSHALWKMDLDAPRLSPSLQSFLSACHAGLFPSEEDAATEFLDLCVGPLGHRLSVLSDASKRTGRAMLEPWPKLRKALGLATDRITELEAARVGGPGPASALTARLFGTGGLSTLSQAMNGLKKQPLSRESFPYRSPSTHQETLSHLILWSEPSQEDRPEDFHTWAKASKQPAKRLIELAVYAPQWADFIEIAMNWPGLGECVWWMHAHTNGESQRPREFQEWRAESIAKRTSLSQEDRDDGAVDVEWFGRAFAKLDANQTKDLLGAAKWASDHSGHTRALLFASAQLGLLDPEKLHERMRTKRHQDSVRAFSLLPLSPCIPPATEIGDRYKELVQFRLESSAQGRMRQAKEKRAVEVAVQNLARTAGYRDPQRLTWTMEHAAVQDLRVRALKVQHGGISVSLELDSCGAPKLAVQCEGKILKSMPRETTKIPKIKALKQRARLLDLQHQRMRQSLEKAMIVRDGFSACEIAGYLSHAMLGPMLASLVFSGESAAGKATRGDDPSQPLVLRDASGRSFTLSSDAKLHIAHPAEPLASGDWPTWKEACSEAEHAQPFQQIFRAQYPWNADERAGAVTTQRMAGQGVKRRQALALLCTQEWMVSRLDGISRNFHEASISAHVECTEPPYSWDSHDSLTLGRVHFRALGDRHPIALEAVPARLFSEVMRDLDMVVRGARIDPDGSNAGY